MVLLSFYKAQKKTCNMALLQSYGLESRIAPDKLNVLCPNIFYNCCTSHDQMKIHKIWKESAQPLLKTREGEFRKAWQSLTVLVDNLDNIDFDNYTTLFQQQAINPVDNFLANHLSEISLILKKDFESEDMNLYINSSLKLKFKNYYKSLNILRQANLCMLCDYDSQKFINTEINQIVYKQNFCTKLSDKFLQFHDDKYNKILRYFVLVEEWVYLTSGRILFQEGDKEIFRRYLMAINKCNGGGCEEYCSEYNVNEMNYMYDGEVESLKTLEKNLTQFMVDITRNSRKYFAEYNHKWDFESFMSYRENESVLTTFDGENPRLHHEEFSGVSIMPSKSFFERIHKINSIEIETLDDIDDTISMFRIQNDPIDLSQYKVAYESGIGIDLIDLAKNMQIQITVNKFISLLSFQTTISRHIPEILTDRTKNVLNAIKVPDVIEFKRDFKMYFKGFRPKNSTISTAGFFPRRRGFQKLMHQVRVMVIGKPPYAHPDY